VVERPSTLLRVTSPSRYKLMSKTQYSARSTSCAASRNGNVKSYAASLRVRYKAYAARYKADRKAVGFS